MSEFGKLRRRLNVICINTYSAVDKIVFVNNVYKCLF